MDVSSDCLDETILNLYSQETFFNILLTMFPWARDYLYYYVYVVYAQRSSVRGILLSITEDDRCLYSPQLAYKYLKEYEKQFLNFAVIIPTCERPKAVKYLLDYTAVLLRRYGIDIIIYDSSLHEDTEIVVNNMIRNGYYNVIYSKYTGLFDGFSLDHKIIEAYKTYEGDYDYIWICRDGLIPIIDDMIEKIKYFSNKKIDCIIVDSKSRNNGVEIEKYYQTIDDCEDLLAEQASRLQTLGMLIFSSRLINKLLVNEPISEENYSLWQMSAPLHLFAKEPYNIVFITKDVFAMNAEASKVHFWSNAERALEQWGYRWWKVIHCMPEKYNGVKEKCLKLYTVDFHPFTPRMIMEMRIFGGLNSKLVRKYHQYIIMVTDTPFWFFRLISILPKFVVKKIYNILIRYPNFLKNMRKKIKNKI